MDDGCDVPASLCGTEGRPIDTLPLPLCIITPLIDGASEELGIDVPQTFDVDSSHTEAADEPICFPETADVPTGAVSGSVYMNSPCHAVADQLTLDAPVHARVVQPAVTSEAEAQTSYPFTHSARSDANADELLVVAALSSLESAALPVPCPPLDVIVAGESVSCLSLPAHDPGDKEWIQATSGESSMLDRSGQAEDEDLLSALDKELSPKKADIGQTEQQQSPLEEANRRLLKQLQVVQQERDELEANHSNVRSELLRQLKGLEKVTDERSREVKALKDALAANEVAFRAAVLELREQHVTAMEQVSRRYNECKEEKEAAVVKYAQTERKLMQQQTTLEKMEVKLLEKEREKDLLLEKVKAAKADKQKLSDSFDEKNIEIQQLKKEVEKQKEGASTLDNKAKWSQNRLKSELEAHKETKQKLDDVMRKLNEAKEEAEQIRKNCQEIIKTYQESEEIKSNSLDIELKKKETELKAHLVEKENTSEALTMRQKELDGLKALCKEKSDSLARLEVKVQDLETLKASDEKMLSELRATLEHQRQESASMHEKLQQYSALESALDGERSSVERLTKSLSELQVTNSELQAEMDACRARQDEMLSLTQKMAERNASLTSENSSLHSRVSSLSAECSDLKSSLSGLQDSNERLFQESDAAKKRYERELSALRNQLEEGRRLSETLTQELDDQRAEVKTVKKKQALSLKELTRELQLLRKKVDSYEGHATDKPNGVVTHSRSNSSGSSDAVDAAIGAKGEWVVVNPKQLPLPTPSVHSALADMTATQLLPETRFVEPDKQKLIEKVVKLQRALARSGEKIEFLEDHNKQLLEEVQKKSRIIQLYVMREDTGSMAADFVDKHKEQLAKRGGNLLLDGRVTLELSMEMNHKLQAVLEDTVLKNMTLKENIDTLGREIARLSNLKKDPQSDDAGSSHVT